MAGNDRRTSPVGGDNLRSFVIAGVLVVAFAGVVIGTASVLSSVTRTREATAARPPAASASDAASSPTEGVAASRGFLADFDLLYTDSEVDSWSTSVSARFVVAAVPDAADRSARLDGGRLTRACRDLDIRFSALEATFMLDAVPAAGLTLLRLDLDDGAGPQVSMSHGRATVASMGGGSMLEANTWYRWLVRRDDAGLRLSLLGPDGEVLSESVAPAVAEGTRATEFCVATRAPARLYLTELKLETP